MFYSQVLLSKKGPLGTVWVAAMCGMAALTKDQVTRTDIPSSVDNILPDVETSYRIVAQLLLGIVRIYSRKVDYLYHHCNEILRSAAPNKPSGPRTSTGRSMQKNLKREKKAVHAGTTGDQQVINQVKETVHSGKTNGVSNKMSSVGLNARAATEITAHTSTEVPQEATHTLAEHLPTIEIPKRFELDSFDLEIAEERDDDNHHHHQLENQGSLEYDHYRASCLFKSHQRVQCLYAEFDSDCFMLPHDALPPEMMDAIIEVNNLPDLGKKEDGSGKDRQNADSACFTPVHDVLPAEKMNTVAEINNCLDTCQQREKPGREVNGDEDGASACSMLLQESEKGRKPATVVENLTCGIESRMQESAAPPDISNVMASTGVVQYDSVEQEMQHEPLFLPQRAQSHSEKVPSPLEPLKVAQPEDDSGPASPKFMVRTPAKNERSRVTRKRRRASYGKAFILVHREEKHWASKKRWTLCDEDIVIPNEILKQNITDASDLLCKRRKAPHTYLDAWKEMRISSLPDTFMDPWIPYTNSAHHLLSLGCTTALDVPEHSRVASVKAQRRLSYEGSEYNDSWKANSDGNTEREEFTDEPKKTKADEVKNSNRAPVSCYMELGSAVRYFQDEVSQSNGSSLKEKSTQVRETDSHSVEPTTKRLDEPKDDSLSHDEAFNAALDNLDEDTPLDGEYIRDGGSLWSARTRTIARCLYELFMDQKCKKEKSSFSLGQVLEGRKRKTSARFFYETLILKSRGLIEVKQEEPYDDIAISGTPQLEAQLQK